jgi:hypothetical protein
VANAGPAQTVVLEAEEDRLAPVTVQLDGGNSVDPGGNPLFFTWELVTLPPGSTATLSDPNAPNPTFAADVSGTYVVQLIVSNGLVQSAPQTVTIRVDLPANTVRISPLVAPVAPGGTFTVPVELQAGTTNIASYLFEVIFDPGVVTLVEIGRGAAPFGAPFTNPAAFASGRVKFHANNATFVPASGLLTLAQLTFQVVATPTGTTSPLTLAIPRDGGVLVDDRLQIIADPLLIAGSVNIRP